MDGIKKYTAEFLGTFGLVFAITSSMMVNDIHPGVISQVGIGLTSGLIVLAMIYTFGDVSGAHFNPAVTFGFWSAHRFPTNRIFSYVLSQCAGALAASAVLKFLFPNHLSLGATIATVPIEKAFLLEVILTFFLMLVIINVSTGSKEKGIMAGIAVGSIVGLEALFAGPLTGASMNPARSLGPALLSGTLNGLWIYLFAPPVGAYLAVLACRCTQDENCCKPEA